LAFARCNDYHKRTMTTGTASPQRIPRPLHRRLLAAALLLCVALGAVPALAHCCADRCHDAEPPVTRLAHCDCSLSGVEPPLDALPQLPAMPVATVDAAPLTLPPAAISDECPQSVPGSPAGACVPDRTTVLRI
jgi:hypothetical protein